MTIAIKRIDNDTFSVSISSKKNTQHIVKFSDKQRDLYELGHIQKDVIIKIAFDFLLAREPNTSILTNFSIDLISNYFPEFETKLKKNFTKSKEATKF
tara:strand:+ start:2101 stop:2394 length:294 start_codon:yes stop_codon:yes gene_type:complete